MGKINAGFRFYIITFLISWSAWISAVFSGFSMNSFPGAILVGIGGAGPFLSVIFALWLYEGKNERKDYLTRLSPLQLPCCWFAAILFLPIIIVFFAVLVSVLAGGSWNQLMLPDSYVANPKSILYFAIFIFIFGPLPEELGWRGYALDGLKQKFNLFWTTIIIGVFWALWHIPLFSIVDYPLSTMDLGFWRLFVYFGELVPKSFVYSLIYFKTGRNIFSAILFHFMCNFIGSIIEIDNNAEYFKFIIYVILAIIIVLSNKKMFFLKKI